MGLDVGGVAELLVWVALPFLTARAVGGYGECCLPFPARPIEDYVEVEPVPVGWMVAGSMEGCCRWRYRMVLTGWVVAGG